MNSTKMDKNTYTYVKYEYLPVSNVADIATEANQFVVVQDDGTLVVNRQVQFQTVQDKKDETEFEDSQSCTVYDITPQHYFVDVTNSAELIVPDNFLLAEGSNNLFTNGYVLQSIPSTNTEQIQEVNVVDQFNETEAVSESEAATSDADKNINLTEITLNDDQYNLLQHKGWVLLEIQNKVYMLDTLGLHDISTNPELIQQLKEEIEEQPVSNKSRVTNADNEPVIKQECDTTIKSYKQECDTTIKSYKQEEASELPSIDSKEIIKENIAALASQKDDCTVPQIFDTESAEPLPEPDKKQYTTKVYREGNRVIIKTDLCFKNIPTKIELGKLLSGKKLIAHLKNKSNQYLKKGLDNTTNGLETKKNERLFEDVIHLALNKPDCILCDETSLAEAKDVLAKLLQVPTFQEASADCYIFITKSIKTKTDGVEVEKTMPVFITGRVIATAAEKSFLHVPDLLKKLVTSPSKLDPLENTTTISTYKVLHMHIEETKCGDRVVAISGTYVKRLLPDFKSRREPYKKVYACSACAKIFQTENELTDHRMSQCLETDSEDKLTIDTDKIVKESGEKTQYYVLKTDKGTIYECIQCSARFNKVSNCIRHNKTHCASTTDKNNPDDGDIQNKVSLEPTHKCNMCSCSYFHSSSLSKHIVSTHILNNNKKIIQ